MFDSACLFWERDCGQKRNCWVYDSSGLSVRVVVLEIGAIMVYLLFEFNIESTLVWVASYSTSVLNKGLWSEIRWCTCGILQRMHLDQDLLMAWYSVYTLRMLETFPEINPWLQFHLCYGFLHCNSVRISLRSRPSVSTILFLCSHSKVQTKLVSKLSTQILALCLEEVMGVIVLPIHVATVLTQCKKFEWGNWLMFLTKIAV